VLCASNTGDVLGTSRVLTVSAATTPRVGRKHFPTTLPLAPKEVVLTFDDGPLPGTTERILDTLRRECVRATFFVVGKEVAASPSLVRRELAEGHTVGNHTLTHALLNHISFAAAQNEIDSGFAAIRKATGDGTAPVQVAAPGQIPRSISATAAPKTPLTPFFRFPGFASTPALLEALERRGIVVFGADFWASDWNHMTPQTQLSLVMTRLHATNGGIILFHDTKAQTAAMLPAFLRALRLEGYRIVHVVPGA
jgi:peptidoglycan/xylan/chitin deacetylase (PgdA/CDA1 family)